VAELLQVRDSYHYHLLSKPNVVGTAVGLYLIRKDEEWPQRRGEGKSPRNKKTYPRTFANSEVRDYSWPCVLALVRNWQPEHAFSAGGRYDPAQIVPKTLFMPDGRAAPVCVVEVHEVPPDDESFAPRPDVPPASFLGGGLPITVNVQGVERRATAGALVTDGHLTYALTARHVCGESGTRVSSVLRGGEVEIGVSSDKQLTRLPFSEVYPDFAGRRSYSSLDVGLIRLDDIDAWTSNIYGLPPIGSLADVHEHNLSLRLIDRTVIGYGAASGLLRGTIKALFYRHRSVGGFDYVGDFLIAPDNGDGASRKQTRRGDSGMIWNLDVTVDEEGQPPKPLQARDLRPLALEWGGQVFDEAGRRSVFAVATSLSNVCKLLDVELVTDVSRGVSGYWGRTGHYSIAAFAIRLVGDTRLKAFLKANLARLSFDLETIKQKTFDDMVGDLGAADAFVPLADVPDEIWKHLDHGKHGREGGRDTFVTERGSDGPEHPNHYADIDEPFQGNKSWRTLCLENTTRISPARWLEFYEAMAAKKEAAGDMDAAKQYRNKLKQGLLPFRVWQFFDAMVGFADAGDVVGFLAAAGCCAHYIGDASQPLHGSVFADGDPSRTVIRHHPKTGEDEEVKFGKGVHSAYETHMVSRKASVLVPLIEGTLPAAHGLAFCADGHAAAEAILKLMNKVAGILDPLTLVERYEEAGAGTRIATLDALWDHFGNQTAAVMVEGARTLAMIWESAWTQGNGAAIDNSKLKALSRPALRNRYIDSDFVPSVTLGEIGSHLH